MDIYEEVSDKGTDEVVSIEDVVMYEEVEGTELDVKTRELVLSTIDDDVSNAKELVVKT